RDMDAVPCCLDPPARLQRGREPVDANATVDPRICNADSVTICGVLIGPRPEAVELANGGVLVDLQPARDGNNIRVIGQVAPHGNPVPCHISLPTWFLESAPTPLVPPGSFPLPPPTVRATRRVLLTRRP